MIDPKWIRILGCYLLCIAGWQCFIYSQDDSANLQLLYFDPRIGITAILEDVLRISRYDSILFDWLIAGWLGVLGILMIVGKSIIRTYVISELILSAPNFVFFWLVIIVNMNPAHGFSIRELYYPVIMMVITTIMPFMIIYWRMKKNK